MKGKVIIFMAILTGVLSSIILYEAYFVYDALGELGLLGIFFSALLSNLTVVGRDMFVPLFLPLTTLFHPLLLGLAAGWGGAVGLITTYYWGRGIAEAVKKEDDSDPVSDWIRRHGLKAIFLVAATPLPDTPIVLLAGSSRLPLMKLLVVEGVGKTVWYTFCALLGGTIFRGLTDLMGSLMTSIIVVGASLIFCTLTSWKRGRELMTRWIKRTPLGQLFGA